MHQRIGITNANFLTGMTVSFEKCYHELVVRGGPLAQHAYDQWRQRVGYEKVVDFVEAFEHRQLFQLTVADIRNVICETEHALGNVPKEDQIPEIEDFTCPFALQHIFHRYVENAQRIPTWQQFWRWMNKQAYPYWLAEIQPLKEQLSQRYPPDRIERAIRWRLGKFYYSALREVDLLVWLRSNSIDVQYHLLADVLLRVDFWVGDILVCIYFSNTRYRAGTSGRKPPAMSFFREAKPPFQILDFEVERQGFGKIWLVSDESKINLHNKIKYLTS